MIETILRPYGSAHDLPSVVEMRQMLTGLKTLAWVFDRGRRHELADLKTQMTDLFDACEFYEILGSRHWILTENLLLDEVKALLAGSPAGDVAEASLIQVVAERVRGQYWQMACSATRRCALGAL